MNAEQIRANLDAVAQRINSRKDLAHHARQTLLARAYVEARDALNALREEETARIDADRRKLERKLFGAGGLIPDPAAAVSRRDANDRAAELETPAAAQAALRRAERDGDATLAKAIAARAADLSADPAWAGIVHAYVAERPEDAETLKAMQALPDTSDGLWKLQQAMQYGLAAPEGLGDVSGYQADALAARPLDGETTAA